MKIKSRKKYQLCGTPMYMIIFVTLLIINMYIFPFIYSDLPPAAYTSSYYRLFLVTKIITYLPMLGVWRLGGLVTLAFPFIIG